MKRLLLLLTLLLCTTAFSQNGKVIVGKVDLRGTASDSGKIVTRLLEGSGVELIEERGMWYLVQSAEYVGWLKAGSVMIVATSTAGTPAPRRLLSTPAVLPPKSSDYQQPTPLKARGSRTYIRGPKGGCYYINSNGKKTYVDHSFCS